MAAAADPRINVSGQKIFGRVRKVLISSAASIAVVALVGGSSGMGGGMIALSGPAAAQAAEQSNLSGFADLVAKVKPAVISVRVKIEREGGADDDNGALPRNSPFYRFFHGPDAQQPRQQITGEGIFHLIGRLCGNQ